MDFKPLFRPKTMAVVGVSHTNERHPANVIFNKIFLRYPVEVFPVNPRGGSLQGEKVFKNQRDELYISHAKYTTCNLKEPHFHIESSKLKVIPNNKVVSGPFHIKVNDIPTPIGLPFGMFPVPKKKVSGVIFPTYGEEKRRGFFLKNGGYYFALNDYIDLTLLGEIYSKGSWGLNAATKYNKRYAYTGNFNMRYNNQKGLNEGDSTVINDFWINWSHSPQTKGT